MKTMTSTKWILGLVVAAAIAMTSAPAMARDRDGGRDRDVKFVSNHHGDRDVKFVSSRHHDRDVRIIRSRPSVVYVPGHYYPRHYYVAPAYPVYTYAAPVYVAPCYRSPSLFSFSFSFD